MSLKLFSRADDKVRVHKSKRKRGRAAPPALKPAQAEFTPAPAEPTDPDPLKRAFQQGRYSTILRNEEQWPPDAPERSEIIAGAAAQLEQGMALVPAGSVCIYTTLTAQPGAPEQDESVEPFLLDVHAVSNARFQRFVDAGGYDELEFWPEEIWPHLIELKDVTGHPGPRYWRNSRHDASRSDHPVVGVSWYEAQAYALWIGQRLPTEAEWQMAASWHINSSADLMRRFPWGDAMDRNRCNVWCSGKGTTVPVSEYPEGAAPNQVRQLVGNTWEWTDSEYQILDDEQRPIVGEMPMHVIRGGAFDTYFEVQATSHFRTGQIALARTYNTGFRCAMNLADAKWINGT